MVTNEWETTFTFHEDTGFVDFLSKRSLDSTNGFVFTLNTPTKICYAWNFDSH